MTQTRTTYAAFALLVAAFGVLASLLIPSAHAPAAQAAQAAPVADVHRINAIPAVQGDQLPQVDELIAATLAQHVGDTGPYTTVQAEQAHLAADRVCEGMIDGAPLMDIQDAVATQQGLTDTEAHDFVLAAHRIQCPSF
jgi:hypothetical protein